MVYGWKSRPYIKISKCKLSFKKSLFFKQNKGFYFYIYIYILITYALNCHKVGELFTSKKVNVKKKRNKGHQYFKWMFVHSIKNMVGAIR